MTLFKLPIFVSQQGLENLQYYRYSGLDLSLLVKYLLAPFFWNPLIEKFPMWLAPNLITLAGGLFMALAMALLNLTMKPQEVPIISVNLFVSLMIFLYQTADNLDGKQARRTKSSSPLGELFDHGVDSIMIGIFGVAIVLNLQVSVMKSIMLLLALMTVFYLSHWEEYHVGTLVLGYIMNPTELQYLTIGFLLFQSFFPQFGHLTIFHVSINTYLYYFIFICCLLGSFKYYLSVAHWAKKENEDLNSSLLRLTQFGLFIFFSLIICCGLNFLSNTDFFWKVSYIFILINAFLTQRLVVKRICKEPIPLTDPILYVYGLCSVCICLFCIGHNEFIALSLITTLLVMSVLFEVALVIDVCYSFSKHLGIRVFVITPKEEENEA